MLLVLGVAVSTRKATSGHQLVDDVWDVRVVLDLGGKEDGRRLLHQGILEAIKEVGWRVGGPIRGLGWVPKQAEDATTADSRESEDAKRLALLPELVVGDRCLAEEVLGVHEVRPKVGDRGRPMHSVAKAAFRDVHGRGTASGTSSGCCDHRHGNWQGSPMEQAQHSQWSMHLRLRSRLWRLRLQSVLEPAQVLLLGDLLAQLCLLELEECLGGEVATCLPFREGRALD